MTNKLIIDVLLEEVMRGRTPVRVIEQYMAGIKQTLQLDQDVMEEILALYPDMAKEDVICVDPILSKYYADETYNILQLVQDIMACSITEYTRGRMNEIIKEHNLVIPY
jgi:hypothetical protein